ncbi:MAG: AraC family transcriptional regulator [Solobacterium sp.]|nr:AraC family transcriptional regulator [Erysipelotrichaceae bacterium]MCI6701627.1 AraC family transcriptional regulator [Solobacterium sp.]MDD6956651.1 AraC family transcriptional regulator [Solobacterium sp.]MDY4641919.1 AraC family transcriptional regulator [Erysipelotrichaceae bacterium]
MIFNKTTNMDFQEFGEVYTERTRKNTKNKGRHYLTVKNKSQDYLIKAGENTYFKVKEGIAMVICTRKLSDAPKTYVIHRVCHLLPGVFYNFVSISDECLIELSEDISSKEHYYINEFRYRPLVPTISVNSILGVYYLVRGPKYDFPGETHNFWEITYIDDGELRTNIASNDYTLSSHSLVFYGPGQSHSQRTETTCSYLTIIFDMSISKEDGELLKDRIFEVDQKERELLSSFIKVSAEDVVFKNDILITCVQQLVVNILSTRKSAKKASLNTSMQQRYQNELLSEIALYIQENIYSPITVEDICYKFAMSRSSIQALFKTNLDITPKQYISDLKFSKAKQMIKNSVYSISEISRMCGFSSIHYFSRKFKQKYGVTPTSYAKSIVQ